MNLNELQFSQTKQTANKIKTSKHCSNVKRTPLQNNVYQFSNRNTSLHVLNYSSGSYNKRISSHISKRFEL